MARRVLITANSAWNVVHFRAPLVAALVGEGHEVMVLAPDDGTSDRITGLGARFAPIAIERGGLSPLADVKLLAAYRRHIRGWRPDTVLAFTIKPNIYASIAARGTGALVINNISGLGTAFLSHGWLERLAKTLYRFALKRSATVFFQNPDDRNQFMAQRLVRSDQARLLAGSGIDLDHFRPEALPHRGAPAILLIARVLRDKGVREFAEAARILRREGVDAHFRLVGPLDPANRSAIGRAEVDGWAAEGLIDYAGPLDDVRPAIAAADCVILPSYREGLPRSLVEAAAMGRPVIASDVPGCRSALDPGVSGLLCAPRSAEALADAMRHFLALSSEQRAAMGDAGRAKAEREFDQRLVVRSYLEALAFGQSHVPSTDHENSPEGTPCR